MMKGSGVDVVVVGAGVVGLSTALALGIAGYQVLVLDRLDRGTENCTWGSAGIVRVGHYAPFANRATLLRGLRSLVGRRGPFSVGRGDDTMNWLVRFSGHSLRTGNQPSIAIRELAKRSRAKYREYEASGIDIGINNTGVVDVYESQSEFRAAARKAAKVQSARILDSGFPAHPTDRTIAGAILWPDDMFLDPRRLLHGLTDACRANGVQLEYSKPVDGWIHVGNAVEAVVGPWGTLSGALFVIAAGAWTSQVAAGLGSSVPIQPGKGYHIDFFGRTSAPYPVILSKQRVVIVPYADRVRAAGVFDVVGHDPTLDPRREELVRHAALQWDPSLARLESRSWVGFRPCTVDGLPVAGRLRPWRNVYVASGHCMQGLELAPGTAEIVTQEIQRTEMPSWSSTIDPARFA